VWQSPQAALLASGEELTFDQRFLFRRMAPLRPLVRFAQQPSSRNIALQITV
jgi:hypothetical protein